MERFAVFFKLKENKAEMYEEAHKNICSEMTDFLTEAGYRNYSIWRHEDMLFAYFEMEDAKKAAKISSESDVYRMWREKMEDYVYIDPETGEKEWPMKLVFLHK